MAKAVVPHFHNDDGVAQQFLAVGIFRKLAQETNAENRAPSVFISKLPQWNSFR